MGRNQKGRRIVFQPPFFQEQTVTLRCTVTTFSPTFSSFVCLFWDPHDSSIFTGCQRGKFQPGTWNLKLFLCIFDEAVKLGVGFKYCLFSPYLGKMNPFWLIFFKGGWNHQLAILCDAKEPFPAMSNVSTRMSFYFESELNLLQGTCILKKGQSNSIQKKHIPYHPWDCYIYLLIYHKTTY